MCKISQEVTLLLKKLINIIKLDEFFICDFLELETCNGKEKKSENKC